MAPKRQLEGAHASVADPAQSRQAAGTTKGISCRRRSGNSQGPPANRSPVAPVWWATRIPHRRYHPPHQPVEGGCNVRSGEGDGTVPYGINDRINESLPCSESNLFATWQPHVSVPRWKRPWAYASRACVAPPSSARPWCRHSSTEPSRPGCCGHASRRHRPAPSTGTKPSGTFERPSCGRSFSSFPTPANCDRWASSRCWTGRPRRWTAWTASPSLTGLVRERPSHISTSRS